MGPASSDTARGVFPAAGRVAGTDWALSMAVYTSIVGVVTPPLAVKRLRLPEDEDAVPGRRVAGVT